MSTEPPSDLDTLPASFAALTASLEASLHAFALPRGDSNLAAHSLSALTDVFALALEAEAEDLPVLPACNETYATLFPPTPLAALHTEDMDVSQLWEQLEMRSSKMCALLGVEIDRFDELQGGNDGSLTGEEREMHGLDDDDESDEFDEDEEDFSGEEGFGEADAMAMDFDGIDDMDDSGDSGDSDDEDEDEEEDDSEGEFEGFDEEDEDFDEDGEEDEEEDEDDDTSRRIQDLDEPGHARSGARRSHPTLDDQFFSIDEFNRDTEAMEALDTTDGKLGADASDDEDEGDFDDDMDDLEGGAGGSKGTDLWSTMPDINNSKGIDEIRYADFFAPPPKVRQPKPAPGQASKGSGKGKSKNKPPPAARQDMDMDLEEDDEDMEGEGDDDEDEDLEGDEDEYADEEDDLFDPEDDGRDATVRAKNDLFAASDDEDTDAAPLSTHAQRLAQLSSQIAQLEAENVAPKQWAMAGEASSRGRAINAILEEDLEFDNVGKQVPIVTEEKVQGLEALIKQRILDGLFNDVERRRPMDAKPFLPSRVFELQDTQSTRSLAQIYEDQYTASSSGGAPAGDDRDGKLAQEHQEIESAWEDICYKLDALSNANFTPKQPKAQISTISNAGTISMETALPPTLRATHLLAPEEVFTPPTAGELRSRSEMTPAEKRAARGKDKRRRRKDFAIIEGVRAAAELTGGGRGKKGEKSAKDAALRSLVKEGKGVTVIGKGTEGKAFDKKGIRVGGKEAVRGKGRTADSAGLEGAKFKL